MTSRKTLDLLVSCGSRAPETMEGLGPHVVIRAIRNALRMTQAQLAKRAGMPQSHLAKIETGKVDVQLSTLRKIFKAMFCELVMLPKFRKPPQRAVAERIKEVARKRVAHVTGTMVSEGQRPGDKMVRDLIRSEEKRLMGIPSSGIWDDPWPTMVSADASLVRDRPPAGLKPARMTVRMMDKEDDRATLRFWLEQPAEARINAVEFLRMQCFLVTGRKALPRLARSIQMRDLHE